MTPEITKYLAHMTRGVKAKRRGVKGAFGQCKFRPRIQELTDVRFMSRPQREAFAEGVKIYV